MKKIIAYEYAWTCENLDNLARIDWEGLEILFDNNTRELMSVAEFNKMDKIFATDLDKKFFYQNKGYLFVGDSVVIIKGRKLPIGDIKTISSFKYCEIPNTFGHKYYTLAYFTDGTFCNILNVKGINNISNETSKQFVKEWYIGGRK